MNAPDDTSLRQQCQALQQAQPSWRAQSTQQRLNIIHNALQNWLPSHEIIHDIAQHNAMSPKMVAWGISQTCKAWRRDAPTLINRAQNDPTALDEGRAQPIPLSGHIWASTLPTSGWIPALAALAIGSSVLIKAPQSVLSSAHALQQALTAHSPTLGACIQVATWPGGSDLDRVLVESCDAILVSGGAEAITRFGKLIAAQAPRHIPWLPFGPGVSLAIAPATTWESREPSLLNALALDVAAYDQRGCLSPQALWLEGKDDDTAHLFCEALASALGRRAQTLPRGELSIETAAAIMQRRSTTLFTGQVLEARDALILYEPNAHRYDNPLHRTLPIHLYTGGPKGLIQALKPYGKLQSAAIAGGLTQRKVLARVLGDKGINRLCAPGKMQTPPATWHHDGMAWLSQLLHFVDVEED